MKFILALILSVTVLQAQTPKEHWAAMDIYQQASIRRSFDVNKPFDLGFTAAAFNAVESAGGRFLIRLGEDAFGSYQQRALYVAQIVYKTSSPTIWQLSRAAQNLTLDREYDNIYFRMQVMELFDRHEGRWSLVWAAWNPKRENQVEEIRLWVRFFRYELGWR